MVQLIILYVVLGTPSPDNTVYTQLHPLLNPTFLMSRMKTNLDASRTEKRQDTNDVDFKEPYSSHNWIFSEIMGTNFPQTFPQRGGKGMPISLLSILRANHPPHEDKTEKLALDENNAFQTSTEKIDLKLPNEYRAKRRPYRIHPLGMYPFRFPPFRMYPRVVRHLDSPQSLKHLSNRKACLGGTCTEFLTSVKPQEEPELPKGLSLKKLPLDKLTSYLNRIMIRLD